MVEYELYYWDVPFRGVFPQLFLEETGAKYLFRDALEIYPAKSLKIHNPGMAPPYLYEVEKERYLAQMPAIMMHLAREHDYLPKRTESLDLALKSILDCLDILTEITRFYGQQLWTPKAWQEFRTDRLSKWMQIFELTGHSHGLKEDKGFLLGSTISVADIATTALFGTMIHSFPTLRADLKKHAPYVLGLCERIEARPPLKSFLEQQREKYGRSYCGGEIEKSLREMME